jgi:hypothetical protein
MDPVQIHPAALGQADIVNLIAQTLKTITVKTQGQMTINKKFDGRGISDFLEDFELQAKLAGVKGDEELCSWMLAYSKGTSVYRKVKNCVESGEWFEAKKRLKETFKIQDAKQALTYTEQLDDLFTKGFRSRPQDIAHALEKVQAVIRQAKRDGKEVDSSATTKRFYKALDSEWRKTLRNYFRSTEYRWDEVSWPTFFEKVKELIDEELQDELNDQIYRAKDKRAVAKKIEERHVYSSSDTESSEEEEQPRPREREVYLKSSKSRSRTDQKEDKTQDEQTEDIRALIDGIRDMRVNHSRIDNLESTISRLEGLLGTMVNQGRPFRGEMLTSRAVSSNMAQSSVGGYQGSSDNAGQNQGYGAPRTFQASQNRYGGTMTQRCFFCGIQGHLASQCNAMAELRTRGLYHRRGGRTYVGPPTEQGREIPSDIFNEKSLYSQEKLILAVAAADQLPQYAKYAADYPSYKPEMERLEGWYRPPGESTVIPIGRYSRAKQTAQPNPTRSVQTSNVRVYAGSTGCVVYSNPQDIEYEHVSVAGEDAIEVIPRWGGTRQVLAQAGWKDHGTVTSKRRATDDYPRHVRVEDVTEDAAVPLRNDQAPDILMDEVDLLQPSVTGSSQTLGQSRREDSTERLTEGPGFVPTDPVRMLKNPVRASERRRILRGLPTVADQTEKKGKSPEKPTHEQEVEAIRRTIEEALAQKVKVPVTDLIAMCPSFFDQYVHNLQSKSDTRETVFIDGTQPTHPRVASSPIKSNMALITCDGQGDLHAASIPGPPDISVGPNYQGVIASYAVNAFLTGIRAAHANAERKRATLIRSLPVIYVRIGPDETAEFIRGIIDTGSEVNILPEEYCEDNGLAILPLDEAVHSKGIHATVVPFIGRVTERVYVAGRWTVCEFMVMPRGHMSAIVLLGMAFISDTHLSLQWVTDQNDKRTMRANFVMGKTRMIVTCQSDVTATQVQGTRLAGAKN